MPLTTKLFSVLPWRGGLNLTQNRAMIQPNQLQVADNVIMGPDFSKKRRKGINFDWDDAASSTDSIIGLHDFWFGASGRSQVLVAVDSAKNFYTYDGGVRTSRTTASAWSSDISRVSMLTFNNRCLIAVDGAGNVIKELDARSGIPAEPNSITDLPGTPPQASILAEHLGRVFANDKTDVDRLHFSETSDPEIWNGVGDSGAIDIRPGDGDPVGITAIVPFKGDLIVFKSTKIYRIIGTDPETFVIRKISDSIGCISPNSLADIDGNDIIFVSRRGIHSLEATDTFGDLAQAYLSRDIQKYINDRWPASRRQFIQARYLPNENSVAFTVTDKDFGVEENNAIWWYNVADQSWFRWPRIKCASIAIVTDSDRQRLYIGTSTTRVAQAFTENLSDTSEAGQEVGIEYELLTGLMDLGTGPYINKAIKTVGVVFEAEGTYTLKIGVTVDNQPEICFNLSDDKPGDLLGVDFVLGSSLLGVSNVMAAHSREGGVLATDPAGTSERGFGIGKYVKLRLLMAGASETIDIQGFLIEYEEAGEQKEVINATA